MAFEFKEVPLIFNSANVGTAADPTAERLAALNAEGAEGWQLVGTTWTNGQLMAYFIRPSASLLGGFPAVLVVSENSGSVIFRNNNITSLPKYTFTIAGEKLRVIDISNNQLGYGDEEWEFDLDLSTNSNLKSLSVANNYLQVFDPNGQLDNKTLITSINAGGNLLTEFENDLDLLLALEELILNDNQLTSFPIDKISLNVAIKKLDLSSNLLTSFDNSLATNIAISKLNLSNNNINIIGQLGTFPASLLDINLSNNNFVTPLVDAVLNKFSNLGQSNGFLGLSGINMGIPTGGVANVDYLSLIGRNWEVDIRTS